MRPSRGKSNSKAPLPSQMLELDAKKMEEKLTHLKSQMEAEKKKKEEIMQTSGSRWKSSNTSQPIKNYANSVIQTKKEGDKVQKIDYSAMNKQFGESISQKQQSLRSTATSNNNNISVTLNKGRPSSNLSNRPASNNTSLRRPSSTQKNEVVSSKQPQLIPKVSSNLIKAPLERRNSKNIIGETSFLQGFLGELNLQRFSTAFEQRGLISEETILKLDSKMMEEMNIPSGFQIKLAKKITTIQLKVANKGTQQAQTPKGALTHTILKQSLPRKGGEEDQINGKNKDNNENVSGNVKCELGKQKQNEEEVNNVGSQENNKKVRFSHEKQVIQQIIHSNNATNMDQQNSFPKSKESNKISSTSQSQATESIGTDGDTSFSQFVGKKSSCWQCYKIFIEQDMIKEYDKLFCSSKCAQSYESFYIVKCEKASCKKRLNKQEGSCVEGLWYCFGICEPGKQDIEDQWKLQQNDNLISKNLNSLESNQNGITSQVGYQNNILASNDQGGSEMFSLEDIEKKYFLLEQELDSKLK